LHNKQAQADDQCISGRKKGDDTMLPIKVIRQYEELPRLWADPFGEFDQMVDRVMGNWDGYRSWHRADIREDENSLYVEMELPGVSPQDVKVNFENSVLTIEGENKAPEHKGPIHLCERRYGKFSRSFRLPSFVDPNNVKAAFKDGMLTVTLAKRPENRPRKIEIKTG
jgi:HSP20 family protein